MVSRLLFLWIILMILTACASTPTAPSVITLPGKGVSFEQFRADDYDCRVFAFQQLEGKGSPLASHSKRVEGAVAATGQDGTSGIPGAALGGAFEQVPATAAMDGGQRQYDIHYIQCMYAKGHRVPMLGRMTGDQADVESAGPKIISPPAGFKPPPPPAGNPPPPPLH
ncbi:hypothetical protein [Nitrosomonas sp.]|uniref:hypothetical protein n=1 Tax=Nitrosomonas sp. TaxID=42353 RepID=UPI001E142FCE|nr:hypothetical protein [Nitrosomonas sp.]MBX3616316.1 hypothetical protein [Nitrosomonas sp.]